MAEQAFAFKSLAQQLHWIGQRSLIPIRQPLGQFRPTSLQVTPLGWAAQSFQQRKPFVLILSPLGQSSVIPTLNTVSPDEGKNTLPRSTDAAQSSASQPVQQTFPIDSSHSSQAEFAGVEQERDRPPTTDTTASIQPHVQLKSNHSTDSLTRSPQSSTEPSITQPSEQLPLTTSEAQISRQIEGPRSPEFTPQNLSKEHDQIPASEAIQTYSEDAIATSKTNQSIPHSSEPQRHDQTFKATQNEPETVTNQPDLGALNRKENTQPIVQLQAVSDPTEERRSDVSKETALVHRHSVKADAIAQSQQEHQSPDEVHSQTKDHGLNNVSDGTLARQDGQEPLPHKDSVHTAKQEQSTQPSITDVASPQPETLQKKLNTYSTAKDLSHNYQPSTGSNVSNPDLSQSADISLISHPSHHHAALLLKPLGFSKTLIQPTPELTTEQSIPEASPSTHQTSTQQNLAAIPLRSNALQRQSESSISTSMNAAQDAENSDSEVQSVSDRPSPPDFIHQQDQPLHSIQRQRDRPAPYPLPDAEQPPPKAPEQWSNLSELVETPDSDDQSSHRISRAEAVDAPSLQLNDFGSPVTSSTASSPSRSDSRSPAPPPKKGDRTHPQSIDQQLETLVYPVYWLMRQQWQVEQERQHHRYSGYPLWTMDVRVEKGERSPEQPDQRTTCPEPPALGSPLHGKLQLLTQQVYNLVQWQWVVEQERNGCHSHYRN